MVSMAYVMMWPLQLMRLETRGYFIFGMAASLLTVILIFKVYFERDGKRRYQRFPSGPQGWPLFGFWPQLGEQPYKVLGALTDLHGPICSVDLGRHTALVVNDRSVLDEILIDKRETFSSLPQSTVLPIPNRKFVSSFMEHQEQQEDAVFEEVHRKFILSATSQLKREILETLIKSELESLMDSINDHREQAVDFRQLLPSSWTAVLERLLLASAQGQTPQAFVNVIRLLRERSKIMTRMGSFLAAPYLRWLHLPESVTNYGYLAEVETDLEANCFNLTSTFEVPASEDGHRSFLSLYLIEQASRAAADPDDHTFNGERIKQGTMVLLEHLHEAPWSSTLWGLLLIARHQDVQNKIYAELNALYGDAGNNHPRWSDRHRLPYTWSAIAEIRRIAPALPLTVLPRNSETSALSSGHVIPPDSCLVANAWQINNDPSFWGDPNHFRPERFRPVAEGDAEGEGVSRNANQVLPYFPGTKTWVDDDVILMPVFLTLSTLLLRFSFMPPEGELTCEDGFTMKPAHGMLRAVPR